MPLMHNQDKEKVIYMHRAMMHEPVIQLFSACLQILPFDIFPIVEYFFHTLHDIFGR